MHHFPLDMLQDHQNQDQQSEIVFVFSINHHWTKPTRVPLNFHNSSMYTTLTNINTWTTTRDNVLFFNGNPMHWCILGIFLSIAIDCNLWYRHMLPQGKLCIRKDTNRRVLKRWKGLFLKLTNKENKQARRKDLSSRRVQCWVEVVVEM